MAYFLDCYRAGTDFHQDQYLCYCRYCELENLERTWADVQTHWVNQVLMWIYMAFLMLQVSFLLRALWKS